MALPYKIVSPVDGRVFATVPYAEARAVEVAVVNARKAQKAWAVATISERAQLCSVFVELMLAQQTEIAEQLAWQMGRPVAFGPSEVKRLAERANHMISIAAEALQPIELSGDGHKRRIEHVPHGVVLVVAPWNYPYLTAVNTIVPALMAGNAVILKPAGQTALCGAHFASAFEKAGLPTGVFQNLLLSHETIAQLISSRQVDFVSFTGSVRAGAAIECAAAGRFLPIGLELGGKDPAYVRADAALESTVANLVDGAFFNSGQSCCGIERIYVHDSRYDEFIARFEAETLRSQKLGSPLDTATTLGPVVSRRAASAIRSQVAAALKQGARAITATARAGEEDDPYIPATALIGVDHTMEVMTEETFGPVAGIMRVTSDSEAVHLMNDSRYGLTASIWTEDLAAGDALARQIATGTCFLNRCDYLDPNLAWVGIKESGRGCSLSSLGYGALTRPKSYYARAHP